MRIVFTLVISILTISESFTQTLRETELWIAEKIETCDYNELVSIPELNLFGLRSFHYSISYTDEGELFVCENRSQPGQESATCLIYIVPIKYISRVSFNVGDDLVALELFTEGTPELLIPIRVIDCDDYDRDHYDAEHRMNMHMFLSKEFLKDNLPSRFKKAMNHLIELHGGEPAKEVF